MSKKTITKLNKIFISVMIPLFLIMVFLLSTIGFACLPRIKTRVQYRTLEPFTLEVTSELSNKEVRSVIEDLVGLKIYSYKEAPLNDYELGRAKLFKREIIVVPNLEYIDYVIILTHEMVHIKHFTSDEIYTNYLTFKYLYESNNEDFKNIAIYHYWLSLKGHYSKNYDMSEHVYNYLIKHNIELFEVFIY